MKLSQTKIKSLIILAVVLVVGLLICSVIQIISINKKQSLIDSQEKQISKLQNELNYYQNQQSQNDDIDDKNSDYIIIEGN